MWQLVGRLSSPLLRAIGKPFAGMAERFVTSDAEHLVNIATRGTEGAVKIAERGVFRRALDGVKSLWGGTPGLVKTGAKVGGGVVAVKEGAEYVGEQALKKIPGAELIKNGGKFLPWLLGAAAIGGLFLAFKDRIFGTSDEAAEVRQPAPAMQPAQAIALTPEEQLLAPQMRTPIALGGAGTVTASYPAAVGDVYASGRSRPQRADNDWQARVGGPKAPVESYAARETVGGTHLAEQQARADAAALQQKVL